METVPDTGREDETLSFEPGDSIVWKDTETAAAFNKPAFGHGEGPFEVIKTDPAWLNNTFMITFRNAKGRKIKMNSSYFIKEVPQP
jgi:hypothetical protein